MSELPTELLAAILAELDDDTPRLVAADWLDEHDDAGHARLIRLQCRLERDDTLPIAERERLSVEAAPLAAALIERVWAVLPRHCVATCVRGFVGVVDTPARLRPADVELLAALPLLERLVAPETSLTPDLLPALERLPNLRSLCVSRHPLNQDAPVAAVARLPRLCEAHHSRNRMSGIMWGFTPARTEWVAGLPEPERASLDRMAAKHFAQRPQAGVTLWQFDEGIPPWRPAHPDTPGPTHVVIQRGNGADALPPPGRRAGIVSLRLLGGRDIAPGALAGLSRLRELQVVATGSADDLPGLLRDTPELESLALDGFYGLDPFTLSESLARLPRLRMLRVNVFGPNRMHLAAIRDWNLREVDVPGGSAGEVAAALAPTSPLAVAGGPVTRTIPFPSGWVGVPVLTRERPADAPAVWAGHAKSVSLVSWLEDQAASWPWVEVPGFGTVPIPPAFTPVAPFDLVGWEEAESVACWAEDGVPPGEGPPLSCDRAWLRLARYAEDGSSPRDWLRERIRPLTRDPDSHSFPGEGRAEDAGPMSVRVYWAARRGGAVVALAAGAGAGRLFPWRDALAAVARRLDAVADT